MTIQNKLLFTLLTLSLIIIASLAAFAQWSFSQGLISYVNSKERELLQPFVANLVQSYEEQGDWRQWQGQDRKFFNNIHFYLSEGPVRQPRPQPSAKASSLRTGPEAGARQPPGRQTHKRAPLFALLDSQARLIAGEFREGANYHFIPIMHAGQEVARLAIAQKESLSQDYEFEIVAQQQNYLVLLVFALLALAGFISFVFARHFVEPINELVDGMSKLTKGNYEQTIESKRKDELAVLNRHFNTLAERLFTTEANRKRWLATVSHELRTPIAILKGEIEAFLDEVRKPTKDALQSIHSEVVQLGKMIDDLYKLTSQQVDNLSVDLQRHNFWGFLSGKEQTYRQYLADKGINLYMRYPKGKFEYCFDPVRMNQLFENLLNNCVKYAQATRVDIKVAQTEKGLSIIVEDNGIGVSPQHFAHIFEYLYRVDEHRQRGDGGVGLGLSLCAQIVYRHHGDIHARASALGGLAICIDLPVADNNSLSTR